MTAPGEVIQGIPPQLIKTLVEAITRARVALREGFDMLRSSRRVARPRRRSEPRERFICYPRGLPETFGTMVIGNTVGHSMARHRQPRRLVPHAVAAERVEELG